jgi:secreted trypsin-like serine protease
MPLAARSPRPRATGTIVGFGEDGRGTIGRKQVGTVRLRRCPRAVRVRGGKVRLTKTLCWRPRDQTNDTCSGDSGGPLIVDGAVAGVTSGGIRAGGGSCPSLLSYDTNVARYRAWIASVVGP